MAGSRLIRPKSRGWTRLRISPGSPGKAEATGGGNFGQKSDSEKEPAAVECFELGSCDVGESRDHRLEALIVVS